MSPKGQKTYFGDRPPPPYLRIWMTAPSLSPGLDQALYPTKLFKDPYFLTIVSLSKDVFERRTSTGSGLFSFLDSGFGQIVSIIVKTLKNTNLVASSCFKMKKTSLPVDVRRSKTPLLKLPIYSSSPNGL